MGECKISQLLKEDNGNFSATRLAFLIWSLGVFAVWAYQAVTCKDITIFTQGGNQLVIIMFTFMTGKVAQKFKENKNEKQKES